MELHLSKRSYFLSTTTIVHGIRVTTSLGFLTNYLKSENWTFKHIRFASDLLCFKRKTINLLLAAECAKSNVAGIKLLNACVR